MVPDTNGFLHLVDINSVDLDNEPAFNAPTDVIFHLFTRQNPTAPQNVALRNNAQLTASNFVGSRQTRFYTHGEFLIETFRTRWQINYRLHSPFNY